MEINLANAGKYVNKILISIVPGLSFADFGKFPDHRIIAETEEGDPCKDRDPAVQQFYPADIACHHVEYNGRQNRYPQAQDQRTYHRGNEMVNDYRQVQPARNKAKKSQDNQP